MASLHKPKTHDAPNPRGAEPTDEKIESTATPEPPAPVAAEAPEASAEVPVEAPAAPAEAPAAAVADVPPAVDAPKTAAKKTTKSTPAPEPVTSGE